MKKALLFFLVFTLSVITTGCKNTTGKKSDPTNGSSDSQAVVCLPDDIYLSETTRTKKWNNSKNDQIYTINYDHNGRIVKETESGSTGINKSYTFDERGRVVSTVVQEKGETTTFEFEYEKFDNPNLEPIHDMVYDEFVMSIISLPRSLYMAKIVRENGIELEEPFFSEGLQYNYDENNRLICMISYSNSRTKTWAFEYYPDGTIKAMITNQNGDNITVIFYDEKGRKSSEVSYFPKPLELTEEEKNKEGIAKYSSEIGYRIYYSENGRIEKKITYDYLTTGAPTEWIYEDGIFTKTERIAENGERTVDWTAEFKEEKDGIRYYTIKNSDGKIIFEFGYDALNRCVSSTSFDDNSKTTSIERLTYYENTNEILSSELSYYDKNEEPQNVSSIKNVYSKKS